MATNYIVSAQKPTVVTHAVVCSFTGPNDLNLILAKTNRLELMLVTPEGLKSYREVPVFGRIAAVKAFRVRNESVDSLLVLTQKHHLAILCWGPNGELRTRASGHIADRVGRHSETGIMACVHSSGLMAFRLYDGLIKVVQWTEGKDLRGFNIRCEDLYIVDLDFLSDPEKPTVVYIYRDHNGRHLKAATINLEDKELSSPPLWKQDNIEAEACMIIPIPQPYGGVIVVGREAICYHKDANVYSAIAPPLIHQSQINCYGIIDRDGQRYLLGDLSGRIFMLLLDLDVAADGTASVKDLKVELLGETSIPECVVYLDNGVVFIGSRFGDSQLVRLRMEPSANGSYISLMDTYVNLAPIRDMVVINADGQQQVITCSGAFKDGSLRIIRNGIGIEELASVDLPGVKALFTLNVESELDDYLVVGFVNETHILKINGEELEDTQLHGFVTNAPTLWAGRLRSGGLAQVTPNKVILVVDGNVFTWDPPSNISVVSVNERSGQVVLACGNQLRYLLLSDKITQVASTECEFEIACIDVSSVDADAESKLCAVAYWTDMSVALRSLPDLNEIVREKCGGEMLARSLLICMMEGIVYLLVALGDGTLYYYQIDMNTGALTQPKKATLGTQPTTLKKFMSRGARNVFACSDRPTVIYSSSQKLVFSNVNLKLVAHMCALNSPIYTDSLVMTDGQTLVIGRIDDIQKLHIRTVMLGESVSRIAYQPETGTIAILVQRNEFIDAGGQHHFGRCASKMAMSSSSSHLSLAPPNTSTIIESEEIEVSSIVVFDANTFEILHSHELGKNELAMSIKSCRLGDDPQPYYAVGTAVVLSDETEAKLFIDAGGQHHFGRCASKMAMSSSSSHLSLAPPNTSTIIESEEIEVSSIVVFDANTFEILHSHELGKNELAMSIKSCRLGDDPQPYYAVGTAVVLSDETEAKLGRLLIFEVKPPSEGGRMRLVHDKEVKGAAYSIQVLMNKLVVAINSCVRLFEWTGEKELRLECSDFDNVTALYLRTKNDLVLVGDLMRSLSVLAYKPMESSFEKIARDFVTNWMTACEIIDTDTFLGAEIMFNLFTVVKDCSAINKEEGNRLQETGMYYLGESVNAFCHGSLIATHIDLSPPFSTPILYGTSDGGLGVIVQLTPQFYDFIHELEVRIAGVTKNCMRIEHSQYRTFETDRRMEQSVGFIDGDLVESLLDMSRESIENLIEGLKLPAPTGQEQREATVEEVLKTVEDLARIH
ncbi:DNA damage-binding protein 1 [Toxocara canis]|uniref:DNA damage-binding protein 1 n=1 Tax=Toxocara canis TaxID=6265 RepID=A0A0B2VTC0_TOXCA|nr:DNA damage-binding protein 1 [Toxocara canis]